MTVLKSPVIDITVSTRFEGYQMFNNEYHYIFSYRVSITNLSNNKVQLINRKWIITDGLGTKREVFGDGVVGQKPIILPNQNHVYQSFCTYETPIGKMNGQYGFDDLSSDSFFLVEIPEIIFTIPDLLN